VHAENMVAKALGIGTGGVRGEWARGVFVAPETDGRNFANRGYPPRNKSLKVCNIEQTDALPCDRVTSEHVIAIIRQSRILRGLNNCTIE